MKEGFGCVQQQLWHPPTGQPGCRQLLYCAHHASKACLAAGVTEIEPGWLSEVAQPLCSFSEPLAELLPSYSAQADAVLSWRAVTFGSLGWELPPSRAQHPSAEERAAVFGAALLEGSVLPAMKGKHILPQLVNCGGGPA